MIEKMKNSRYRKLFGVLLIVYGVIAFVTPGIPGAWFIFIGLEFFGIKLLWGEKLKALWRSWRKKKTQGDTEDNTPTPPPSA
jgi:hypothetical protein